MYEEYPHKIYIIKQSLIPDGIGGFVLAEKEKIEIDGFIDTPRTYEKFESQKLKHTFDRYMYIKSKYINLINAKEDLIEFNDVKYHITSDLEDQGGMNEVYRIALKCQEETD